MAKKKQQPQGVEKKPVDALPSTGSVIGDIQISKIDSNTRFLGKQQISEEQDNLKGKHFTYVVYPESAPDDWIEQLRQSGLRFVVSPLHDKDINADNTPKKEHYHVIVSWGNNTTYKSARALCNMLNCPMPQLLRNCNGMYRYLTHKDNPEKYQYTEKPNRYNGWIRPLDNTDISSIKEEIFGMIYTRYCTEYGELLMICQQIGSEYFEVASTHTVLFKAVCDSFRHNPYSALKRRHETVKDETEKQIIGDLLQSYHHAEFYDGTEDLDDARVKEDK